MIYKFIDSRATFVVKDPHRYPLYFPLTNQDGSLLSALSPRLAGDIKQDNDHFLTPPAGMEDLRSNLLCRRDFFIKSAKSVFRASSPAHDTLEAGLLYHKLIKKRGSLRVEILNFIPHDQAAEIMWIKVRNAGAKELPIVATSFIPLFGRSERTLRDHRHVSSLLNRIYLKKYGIRLQPTMVFDEKGHTANETSYFVYGFEEGGIAPRGQFPTLDYFYGEGDIVSPDAIMDGVVPVRKKMAAFDGKEACAAFRFKERILKRSEEVNYFLIMGITQDEGKADRLFTRLNSKDKIVQSLQRTKNYWTAYLSKVNFDFQDTAYNNWLRWVSLQPALRKLFGCSFLPHFDYGKGGRGWRDLWQDALTLLLFEPDKAKDCIFNNFKGVRIDGSNATIITKEGAFLSDRNRISRVWMDHGVWPYLTLRLYLNKTGDIDFLLQETSYFRDRQLCRAGEIDSSFEQDDYLLRTRSGKVYRGSVLEHLLVQNLVAFFNVGAHNVMRLENADWNDGLDMAAEKGESVAFSFMYAHNLKDMCSFLCLLGKKRKKILLCKELALLLDSLYHPVPYQDFAQKQRRLSEYLQKTKRVSGKKIEVEIADLIRDLQSKAEHVLRWLQEREWLQEGFFNGYYDNRGRAVEGSRKGTIRMMLQSQVFAILSGASTDAQVRSIWNAAKKYLWDGKLKGFRLNTDFGELCLDFGRAFGFAYGDKENGAFFNHMVVLFAYALYGRGFIREGGEALRSVYEMACAAPGILYPGLPEYFNREGKGLYFYLTGSASWYLYTLFEEILGIRFMSGDLIVAPQLNAESFFSNSIKVSFDSSGRRITVVYRRGVLKKNTPCRLRRALFNNKEIPCGENRVMLKKKDLIHKENTIILYLA